MKKKYKINEIAGFFKISRQTLIYYDEIGLFKPKFVDTETSYRYYGEDQFSNLRFILILKEAGFSLKEIREYTKSRSPEESLEYLEEKKRLVDLKIKKMIESKLIIDKKISEIKNMMKKDDIEPQIIYLESMEAVAIQIEKPCDYLKYDKTFSDLMEIREELDIKGDDYFVRISKEDIILGNTMEVKTIGFFTPTSCNHKNSLKIEGGWFASIIHKDTWDTIEESYKKLLKYIKDNGYEVIGDSMEFFNEVIVHLGKGEGSTIQITFPVKYRGR
ncbi:MULTISPECIES: MerR family transcriptional regulator [Psychrilyobacter]|uniref:MerR family transcriptional regulator n=1 Tax=Psychrilyobacter piezotolerans TaxID=2293438 RepID=A0ABX9KHA8_9FUSO|nr:MULTISPECIES: MerR family transcriptional regulator [Psychrilyobacter]MCS5420662.1 MerR family transcriptional regulator [Psychrilyobacter sp. S5]NDI77836.1 MerR family transcriptional regulator [Psychrilyobacter piezotolerans]RDE62310.1 MerR family transcriptional regulator [Psychrilyobacter sp. S5]REI41408.1 MerR family transcriptional regulator [Psychrilyobacter piezotolerans]